MEVTARWIAIVMPSEFCRYFTSSHRGMCRISTRPISILITGPRQYRLALRLSGWILVLCLTAHVAIGQPRLFRWAGDAEGGAPFVEADPSHPEQQVGFDVEVAGLLARGLG